MKRSLSFFSLFFLLIYPSFALIKDLTIKADAILVDKEKSLVEARGSAEVVYKDVTVHSQHLVYNSSSESLWADGGFNLFYEGLTIEGETLFYEVGSGEGNAKDFGFNFEGMWLAGKDLSLKKEEYQLGNVSFSTCGLPEPHYRVSAADVIIYPEYQRLVAYWGFFWLGRFPLIPFPTYIYDFRARDRDRKNLPPFPEVGSNSEDGSYVSERLAWNLNQFLSGTYMISYASNKGMGGGVDGDYIINERNMGNFRLYGNSKDNLFGGVTHNLFFGGEIVPSQKETLWFAALPKRRRYELEMNLSSRERINYERVSYTPNLIFRSTREDFFRNDAKYDLELSSGLVAEDGNTKLFRGGANFNLYGDYDEFKIGYLTPSLGISQLYYSNGTRWLNYTAGLDLDKNICKNTALSLGYQHYWRNEGQSPFRYEMYRFRAADRLKAALWFLVGETRAKVAASYFLDNYSPEDIDYTLFFSFHCYNLEVIYRSLRSEFALGFSLAERRQ
jgi:hypothetical protein